MESFEGKLAVVTGGGTGMGRELVLQLAADGVLGGRLRHQPREPRGDGPPGRRRARRPAPRVTTHLCDVGVEADVQRFRDEVLAQHATDHVHLVFNNAGIGGGGSFLLASREEWDRTFEICWGGVYNGCRAFVPLLVAADEGHLVNTSSVNGFWASLGPGVPHTAYSAAKFAVKGFTRGAPGGLPRERAARRRVGRHARPHRHRHRQQQPQALRAARGRAGRQPRPHAAGHGAPGHPHRRPWTTTPCAR